MSSRSISPYFRASRVCLHLSYSFPLWHNLAIWSFARVLSVVMVSYNVHVAVIDVLNWQISYSGQHYIWPTFAYLCFIFMHEWPKGFRTEWYTNWTAIKQAFRKIHSHIRKNQIFTANDNSTENRGIIYFYIGQILCDNWFEQFSIADWKYLNDFFLALFCMPSGGGIRLTRTEYISFRHFCSGAFLALAEGKRIYERASFKE